METTGGVIIIFCGLVLTIVLTIIYTVYIIIYIRKIHSRKIERIYTEKDIIPCPKSYIQAPTSPIKYNGIDIKIDFIKKNGGEVFYYKENDFIYFVVCFKNDHLDDLEFIFYTTLNKIAESYNDLELQKYTCVLRNVLHIAIRDTTQKVFDKYLEENKQSEQSV